MSKTRVLYTFLTTERYISLTGWKYKTTVALGITRRTRQTVYKAFSTVELNQEEQHPVCVAAQKGTCMISIKNLSIFFFKNGN